jgi:NAD(P)-dependent dehydrogenase (short-subunit alcohol dehydrogenase family)
MLLENKHALIFAAGGAIGAAVARRLAAEGARVFLSGRTEASVERVARELDAPWERVDATNDAAVTAWVDRIAGEVDGIDIVFNAIGPRPMDAGYATRSTTIPYDRFLLPLTLIPGSQFLTARAAARHMVPRGRGAIVFLSASLISRFTRSILTWMVSLPPLALLKYPALLFRPQCASRGIHQLPREPHRQVNDAP